MRNVPILCLLLTTVPLNASAAPITYAAVLSGAAEFPANASTATGFATVVYDPDAHTLLVDVIFSNLTTGNTAAHIHCCVSPSAPTPTAGVATTTPTFAGFPTGAVSGSYLNVLDLTLASSFRAGFITDSGGIAAAELALANGLADGFAYFNIHTSTHPGGEIRGFLQPVPEPATLGLLSVSLLAMAGRRLRRRR